MPATPNPKSIMVAMSGGVDSAVCAMLLLDAGHRVRCVYFIMSDAHLSGQQAASDASASLGLELDIVDLREAFKQSVILPFCRDYCDGITPNPCILCNPQIKFKALCDTADKYNCDYIATGHYARIESCDNRYILKKTASIERDQSYMLYALEQSQLSRLLLPLGDLTKQQVRDYARQRGLSAADQPDSQEICFIPDNNYPAYINGIGYYGKPGSFIAPDGTILQPHKGVEYYTVGQRRGLGISLGQPVFVQEILSNGDIQLGYSGQEFANGIEINCCKANPLYTLAPGQKYTVKIRSAAQPAKCTIDCFTGDMAVLRFEEPQRAPAPGQAAVLYDEDYVVGGGFISDTIRLNNSTEL